MKTTLLDYLRCSLCQHALALTETPNPSEIITQGVLRCTGCGHEFAVENGIPNMLAPQLPRYTEKMREASGWVALSKAHGWYEASVEIDLALPDVVEKLGWDPVVSSSWVGTAHSFHDMLARFVRPGLRVLEIGAAKSWAGRYFTEKGCTYTGCDLMADPQIGLGRAHFFREQSQRYYEVVQADAEALPFADNTFDLVFAVAALHHALDLPQMVGEMARVVRQGGIVASLSEGVRSFRAGSEAAQQATEKAYGINEHVYTLWHYYAAFWRHRLWVTKIYQAADDQSSPKRTALVGWLKTMVVLGYLHDYDGVSIYSYKF